LQARKLQLKRKI